MLAVVGSMYAFAAGSGIVPEGTNPARGIEKFKESRRERFLTSDELTALRARYGDLPLGVADSQGALADEASKQIGQQTHVAASSTDLGCCV